MNLINSEFKISKILVGQMETNCYILISREKKAFIIDPGDCGEKILKFIKEENIEVKYILNTHGHFDHTGANNIKMQMKNEVLLGIHKNDLAYLSNNHLNLSALFGVEKIHANPDLILHDNQIINLTNKISIKVIHTPGHTPGSVCFKFKNYLFSGDLLFCNGVGRTDLPGGDEHLLLKSLKKICQIGRNTIILPGHGPETTLDYELKTNPYIAFDGSNHED